MCMTAKYTVCTANIHSITMQPLARLHALSYNAPEDDLKEKRDNACNYIKKHANNKDPTHVPIAFKMTNASTFMRDLPIIFIRQTVTL